MCRWLEASYIIPTRSGLLRGCGLRSTSIDLCGQSTGCRTSSCGRAQDLRADRSFGHGGQCRKASHQLPRLSRLLGEVARDASPGRTLTLTDSRRNPSSPNGRRRWPDTPLRTFRSQDIGAQVTMGWMRAYGARSQRAIGRPRTAVAGPVTPLCGACVLDWDLPIEAASGFSYRIYLFSKD